MRQEAAKTSAAGNFQGQFILEILRAVYRCKLFQEIVIVLQPRADFCRGCRR